MKKRLSALRIKKSGDGELNKNRGEVMKYLVCLACVSLGFLFISPLNSSASSAALVNRIEGQVYDPNRVPVADAFIELLNEVDTLLSRTKTNSTGRFSFIGVSSGRFRIKVLPLGKNLMTDIQDVEVVNPYGRATDVVYVDFYLRYDKRTLNNIRNKPAESVFVQEVPDEAKRLYETGIRSLEKGSEKGLSEIESAIKVFPEYFEALKRLGQEYNARKDYQKAYPYLIRAIDVNSRSTTAFYSLAFAFYQLNEIPAALKAAKAVVTLDGNSTDGLLLYGTVLRVNKNYQEAEKTLVKAKTLTNNTNPEVYWQLALVLNKLNRNKEAADELEAYLKLVPDSPDRRKIQETIEKLRSSKQG